MPKIIEESTVVRGDGWTRRERLTIWDCGCDGSYHGTCGDIAGSEPLSDWEPPVMIDISRKEHT